jgi:hypothetical protein
MISFTQRSDRRKKSRRSAPSRFEYIYQDIDRYYCATQLRKKCAAPCWDSKHRIAYRLDEQQSTSLAETTTHLGKLYHCKSGANRCYQADFLRKALLRHSLTISPAAIIVTNSV